jgi:hypothetical protein
MGVSPTLAQPEGAGNETAAPVSAAVSAQAPNRTWVRPAAAVVMVLSALAAAGVLWRYLQSHGTLAAASDTPPIAAVIVLAVVAVMALAVLVFRPERGDLFALSATSAAWSVALLIALAFAWGSIAGSERQNRWRGTPVISAAESDAYLAGHLPAGIDTIRIPTGVLVQSMEFLNGDNVQITGYVWQRYGPGIPEDFVRGVVLVEGIKEAYDAKEVYRYVEDGVETVGWYFAATLRQAFSYAEFPFDEQDVWIRFWARDFAHDVVLAPDFSSYGTMHPGSLPGVETEFVYSGWSPVYSGFSFDEHPFDTSFGIGDAGEYAPTPELYFNLILDRNIVGPMFEHLVFAVAVAVLLFGLLALTTDDENLKGRFGLSTAGVLGSASGLLFAVILKHNQLRGVVGSPGISYIEFIPILLYGAIVVVVLNAILLASPWKPKFIAHRNNLLPVLAYWPVLLGLLLVLTLWVFFRT